MTKSQFCVTSVNKQYKEFIKKIFAEEFTILSSLQQLEELAIVLGRPKFRKYFTDELRTEFISIFLKIVEIIDLKIKVTDCRDKKDNFILETAVNGNASVILSSDNDLLELNSYKGIKILTFKVFFESH